ncbi:Uncharacterized membrane protein [Desulfonispora thiosulfatigenes DSM 11270]|uniref:Uncharacterized membrane protein n=1 Tax=Desulfonispora thiosulfatigenes DSM 11270 TaxID=656914 RepID=A0A1W1UR01_DESTI|nr:DUF975 family protein [Desulfonispora thiosulfatigenes]SMB83463.1 Uncharacterized membrane protein [Desulfonispora thiosulfatigenes DSM 11270]
MHIGTKRLQEPSELRELARDSLAGKWSLAVAVCFVAWILADAFTSGNTTRESTELFKFGNGSFFINYSFTSIGNIINLILGGPIAFGVASFFLKLIRETEPEFMDLFSGLSYFLKTFVLDIVTTIFIILWTLLFIIPGIIAALRYSMAYYILNDNPELSALEAITQSTKIMIGHKMRLLTLWLSFAGWFILCLLTVGIGFLWFIPYLKATEAHFYEELKSL